MGRFLGIIPRCVSILGLAMSDETALHPPCLSLSSWEMSNNTNLGLAMVIFRLSVVSICTPHRLLDVDVDNQYILQAWCAGDVCFLFLDMLPRRF
jgi:hypothetical protein